MGRLVTAAHLLVYLNGRPYGKCAGINFGVSTPPSRIRGVDSIDPYELGPSNADLMFNMVIFKTIGDGGLEGAGINPTHHYLPKGKYFSIQVVERLSRTTVFKADKCRVSDQKWSIEPKLLVRGNITFEALSWSNEVSEQHS